MNQDFFYRNRRRIVIGFGVIFAVVIVWSVIVFVGRIGKLPLVVSVVPSNATIRLDGEEVGNGTKWLPAGTYKVVVVKDGFEQHKKTVVVTEKKEQNVLAISLRPKTEDAKKWAEEHRRDYQKNEQYGAIEAGSNGKYFSELHPITTKLPYDDPYFKIGYIANSDQSISLTIATPSPRYRFYAVEKIRELGYDPTDYKVIFKDFNNPLEKK